MSETTNKKFGKIRGVATITRANGTKEDVDFVSDNDMTPEQFEEVKIHLALGQLKGKKTQLTQ
jgi:hypothetical protein